MKSKQQLLDYWKNPPEKNQPDKYLLAERFQYSRFLAKLVEEVLELPKNASILEIGCNTGRNLFCLNELGYNNLSGVDINPKAFKSMSANFPTMNVARYTNEIEKIVRYLPVYDLVFTVAVFQHIHPDSEWIFAEIPKIAKNIITMENESLDNGRHTPRDYSEVFGKYYDELVLCPNKIPAMPESYVARIFSKRKS